MEKVSFLSIPNELFDIITKINDPNERLNKDNFNNNNYFKSLKRLIDPIILCTIYGIYKLKNLPPDDIVEIKNDKEYEFNVNISNHSDIINHLLLMIWLKKNKLPDENTDLFEYRNKLYYFIEKIKNEKYFYNIIIPYYLKSATTDNDITSFLYRLRESSYVEYEQKNYSQEFLFKEFQFEQNSFYEYIKTI